jgi:serine/threonine-protein kinase
VDEAMTSAQQQQARFVVESELGRGGMGSVQRVFDTATERTLALKRLLLDPAKPERHEQLRSSFELEFHTLSQLNHPRIIKVFDYGRDPSGPYYTMELVEGRDLRALSPMPWQLACRAARDVV